MATPPRSILMHQLQNQPSLASFTIAAMICISSTDGASLVTIVSLRKAWWTCCALPVLPWTSVCSPLSFAGFGRTLRSAVTGPPGEVCKAHGWHDQSFKAEVIAVFLATTLTSGSSTLVLRFFATRKFDKAFQRSWLIEKCGRRLFNVWEWVLRHDLFAKYELRPSKMMAKGLLRWQHTINR